MIFLVEQALPGKLDKNFADTYGAITDKLGNGKSVESIKKAIHAAKNAAQKRGRIQGVKRNPDVVVDCDTGEIYPKGADGVLGDSIGNIYDYFD
jgi:hypothetical protein